MTTLYCARLASLKTLLSSDVVTVKLLSTPSCWIAAVASSMLECRNAAVSEKTRALNGSPSAAAAAEAFGSAVHGTASARGVLGSSALAGLAEVLSVVLVLAGREARSVSAAAAAEALMPSAAASGS